MNRDKCICNTGFDLKKIKKFKLENIRSKYVIAVFGPKKSGKTNICSLLQSTHKEETLVLFDEPQNYTLELEHSVHYGFRTNKSAIITTQSCSLADIPPKIRADFDYVFITDVNRWNVCDRKKLYKCFLNVVPTFKLFDEIMNTFTTAFECLVLDTTNLNTSTRLEDVLSRYRPEKHTLTAKLL
jgi:hypothetical protein